MISAETTLVIDHRVTEFDYDEKKDKFYCPPKDEAYMTAFFNSLATGHPMHEFMKSLIDLGWFQE